MTDPILIMSWLWAQTPARHELDVSKVNRWAEQIRASTTIPHRIACVTRITAGLDPRIEVIEPPGFFEDLRIKTWKEQVGAPQCYRRLALYHPDAARLFGAEWIVQSDIDMIGLQSFDPLFERRDVPYRVLRGTTTRWPYNGSLVMIKAGSRARVWQQFTADPERVATAARSQYVGSDQAVIAHLLKGERTFDESDGVYCFSTRQVKSRSWARPPMNARIVYYPGEAKPWNNGIKLQWMRDAWEGKRPLTFGPAAPRVPVPRLKIRAYRDGKGWGTEVARAAAKTGTFCTMFGRPSMVQGGIAFVRLDQQGSQRAVSKGIVEELGKRDILTLPTLEEARWYDDKGRQLDVLRKWMPPTLHLFSRADAEKAVGSLGWPMVSKSVDGSASKGVRLINNEREAHAEIERVFAGGGIPSVYDRVQRGYVYWQQFQQGNPCDYRVCVVGGFVYGLVRRNRSDDFRASGSGDNYPITLKEHRERSAVALCIEIANAISTNWMAFNVVFTLGDVPVVLEMSSAWTMSAYLKCPMFKRSGLIATRRSASESWEIAVQIMQRMWADKYAEPQKVAVNG